MGPCPPYLLRDRDKIYGAIFRHRVNSLDMREVLITPHSPWQNPFVERLIGSIRRECLDHVIIFNELHLKCTLRAYSYYYHKARTYLALDKRGRTTSIHMPCPGPPNLSVCRSDPNILKR